MQLTHQGGLQPRYDQKGTPVLGDTPLYNPSAIWSSARLVGLAVEREFENNDRSLNVSLLVPLKLRRVVGPRGPTLLTNRMLLHPSVHPGAEFPDRGGQP